MYRTTASASNRKKFHPNMITRALGEQQFLITKIESRKHEEGVDFIGVWVVPASQAWARRERILLCGHNIVQRVENAVKNRIPEWLSIAENGADRVHFLK